MIHNIDFNYILCTIEFFSSTTHKVILYVSFVVLMNLSFKLRLHQINHSARYEI